MGKNSTPEKSTLDKEKYKDEINSLRDDMQRLKDEVQAIRVAYPWGPEYEAELLRLIDVCREKHSYRSFLAEFNTNGLISYVAADFMHRLIQSRI
mgnify:CR=1 FL=1